MLHILRPGCFYAFKFGEIVDIRAPTARPTALFGGNLQIRLLGRGRDLCLSFKSEDRLKVLHDGGGLPLFEIVRLDDGGPQIGGCLDLTF